MATPLYKKFKPFLAMRYAADPPRSSGGYLPHELMHNWVLQQLACSFDMEGAYGMPSQPIDDAALAFFTEMERNFERLLAAAREFGKAYEDRNAGASAARIVLPIDRLREIDEGVVPIPPPKPGPGDNL